MLAFQPTPNLNIFHTPCPFKELLETGGHLCIFYWVQCIASHFLEWVICGFLSRSLCICLAKLSLAGTEMSCFQWIAWVGRPVNEKRLCIVLHLMKSATTPRTLDIVAFYGADIFVVLISNGSFF